MSPRRSAHPFWRYSLRSYARDGVERACLGLQNDCGADVNLLLFCCWTGSQGRSLDKRTLRRAVSAVRPWQEQIVRPLRRARRALKRSDAGLHRLALRLELEAEYVEQLMLARIAADLPPPSRRRNPHAAAANLERYLALLGAPSGRATKRRMVTLCRARADPANL